MATVYLGIRLRSWRVEGECENIINGWKNAWGYVFNCGVFKGTQPCKSFWKQWQIHHYFKEGLLTNKQKKKSFSNVQIQHKSTVLFFGFVKKRFIWHTLEINYEPSLRSIILLSQWWQTKGSGNETHRNKLELNDQPKQNKNVDPHVSSRSV